MRRDDPAARDDLDHALDALADGNAGTADRWLAETDNRLHDLDAAFALAPETMSRLWDGLMATSTASEPGAVRELVAPSSANGVVPAAATSGRWRMVAPPGQRSSGRTRTAVEEGRHGGLPLQTVAAEVTASRGGWWARRWSVAEVSTVVLLILVLATGYAALRLAGSGDPDDGEPTGAGLAAPTNGALILPTPTTIPTVTPISGAVGTGGTLLTPTAEPTVTPVAVTVPILPTPTSEPARGVASSGDTFPESTARLVVPPILLSIQVDAEGVLAGDATALSEAKTLLENSGIRNVGCAELVLAIGHGETTMQGVQLGHQVNELLQQVFPGLASAAAFDAIGTTDGPRGKVDLRVYQSWGCGTTTEPVVEGGLAPTPTPASATFVPTHRVTSNDVNFRTEPSFDADVITILQPETPLRSLGEEETREGENWLRVETEDGQEGWVVAAFVGALTPTPTPTPAAVGGTSGDRTASIQITGEGDIYVTVTADGTVVFEGFLTAGETAGPFTATRFEIYTSDGSLTLFTNEYGETFYMGYGSDETYTLLAD